MRNSAVAWALAAGLLSLSQASALELGDRSEVDAGSVGDSIGSVGGAARDTSRAVGQAVPEVARDLLTPNSAANSAAQPTEPDAGQFGDPLIISADPTTLVGRQLITSDAAVLGTVRAVQIGAAGEPEILIISLGEQEIRVPVELGTLSDQGIRLDASAADVRAFFELSPAPALVAQGSDAAQTLSPALSQPPLTEQQDSMATDVPALPPENQVSLSEQGTHVQMPASALPAKIANSDSGSLAPPDPVHVAFTTESDSTQRTEPSQPQDSRAPEPTLASLLVGPPLYGALLVAMAGALLASKRGREILRQSLPPHLHLGARSGRNAGAVIKRKRGTRKIRAAAGLTATPSIFSSGVARGQRLEGRGAVIAE